MLKASGQFLGLLNDAQTWWQTDVDGDAQAMIDKLLSERAKAKADKDFTKADAIRDRLIGAGVEIQDQPGGAVGIPGAHFDPTKLG